MKCQSCGHENPADAVSCASCATPLTRACANCGSEVAVKAKFCSQCGQALKPIADYPLFSSPRSYTPQHLVDKILTVKTTLEGERKQITVLFADIKGSMEVLVERDIEDARTILHSVVDRMIEAVHRYEGTVHSVMGDGIMALFGAPLAHEDHAVRACFAALRMQENIARFSDEVQRSHGAPIMIRVGLNSGEIIISGIGTDLQMDYSVVGQTVHLASRMEQMAKPGSILATANTFHFAEGYIAAKPLGPVPVKGLAEEIQIYEVVGAGAARTRLQAAAVRGLTHFVGREAELEELRNAQQLASHAHGQVVAIVGPAGVGKSRLVHEFVHSHHVADWLVLKSNSASYGHATPYLPIIELLKVYFKINTNDAKQAVREKVSRKILPLDPSLQDAILPVLDLLNALEDEHPFRSLDPLQHRHYTYQAIIRLFLCENRLQPVAAIFDDVHWYDSLSLGLLNELVVRAQDARMLLIVTCRPEYHDDWRDRQNYRQLRLDPLVSDNLAELLQVLLGSDPSLQTLKSFLIDRASGNPFFVEEIVRSLVDSGVLEGSRGQFRLARPFSSLDVPPTVQAVLAARIDGLPAPEKRLLQEAAVIGHDVPFALLHSISGLKEDEVRALLDNVQAAEFLNATQLFPDPQYAFIHSLTHDVTYNGVLRDRRRDIHARIVEVMEELYAERLGEHTERLAYHAVRGELREKSVHYLRLAGGKAAARSALADARTRFEEALTTLKTLPQSRDTFEQAFEIRFELRPVLRQLGEGQEMLLQLRDAEVLAKQLQDDRRLGLVYAFMVTVQATLDDLDEALATGARALEIAERLGDMKIRVVATSCIEQAHCYRGEYELVVELARKALATLPANWTTEYLGMTVPPSVFDRACLIMSLAELGRFAEAAPYETEAISIAESTEHAFTIGWAHFAASMPPLLRGDWVKALSRVEHWIKMVRTGNAGIHLPWAIASSAWALAQIGEKSEALHRVAEAEHLLERQAARGIVGHRGWAYQAAGRACLLLDRLDDAQRLAELAVATSQRQPGFAAHARHLLGDIAAHPDRFDPVSVIGHYQESLKLAQKHGMRPLVAHCHVGLGQHHRRDGKSEAAREHLTTATAMYREMEMSFWLKQHELQ